MGIYILLSFVLSNKIQRKDRSKLSVLFSSEQFVSSVYMPKRDRRVSKTKKAIYQAFLQLLNDKGYDATTVQDIIDLADVGRSTFYCHYESKELLLDELCRYLFHHLFEREEHLTTEDYLAHIFLHFQKNQDHLIQSPFFQNMTTSSANYTRNSNSTCYPMVRVTCKRPTQTFQPPTSSFCCDELYRDSTWWLKKGKSYTEEQVVRFYLDVMEMTSTTPLDN